MSQIICESIVVTKGEFPAICDATFHIEGPGACFIVVTGENGSGKATLLKSIAGINPVIDLKRTATYIGHEFNYLNQFKVLEHLELNQKLDLHSRTNVKEIEGFKILSISEALDFCRLSKRKNLFIEDLSVGQQRRLQLACAFMRSTDLVLIDEPHAGLDANSKDVFDELFGQQFISGRSLIIATHDAKRILHLATDFLEIKNGVVNHVKNVQDI